MVFESVAVHSLLIAVDKFEVMTAVAERVPASLCTRYILNVPYMCRLCIT